MQPLIQGNGTSKITRYYFDVYSKTCRKFSYKGSKGNANNFLNLQDCELICPGKICNIFDKQPLIYWASNTDAQVCPSI